MPILAAKRHGSLSAVIEHGPPNSEHCYVSEVKLTNSSSGSFLVEVRLLNPLWTPLTSQEVLQVAKWIMVHDGIELESNQVVEDKQQKILLQTYRIKVNSEHTILSSNP